MNSKIVLLTMLAMMAGAEGNLPRQGVQKAATETNKAVAESRMEEDLNNIGPSSGTATTSPCFLDGEIGPHLFY